MLSLSLSPLSPKKARTKTWKNIPKINKFNRIHNLLLAPGADELLALGGDDADVGVGGGAGGHAPGAEAAGEGEDADDGVGTDLAGPDLEVVGAADAVDLEVVDGGGEGAAGGLDGGPVDVGEVGECWHK